MTNDRTFVIVGASPAGAKAAETRRALREPPASTIRKEVS
jgi:hypothetical protein